MFFFIPSQLCEGGLKNCKQFPLEGSTLNSLSFLVVQDTARDILKKAPGVVVIDDRSSNHFPTPLEVSNKDDVAVGRIRRDLSQEGNHG
jgi:aspartate-semialdehyde dehydrogenase